MSIAQFGPKLLAVWQKAATEVVLIPCGKGEEGRKNADRLRFRLYDLRKAMERENHPLFETSKLITLRKIQLNGEYCISADSSDASLDSILDRAGIVGDDAPELPELP
jgi:hypothetical protein